MLKINKLILLGALIAISFLSANNNEDNQTTITLAQINEVEGSITLDYQSLEDIYGFQFQVFGVQLKDEFECDLQSGGINTDNGLVLAIDFGGAYLPQGDGTLIKLFYEFVDTPTNVEISGIEISGSDGTVLIADQTEYLTLPATPQDCGDVFNGTRTIDEYNNCCLSEELAYWYPDNDGDGLPDCCLYNATAEAEECLPKLTKEEFLMNVAQKPETRSDVFIERGKTSVFERTQRLAQTPTIGELELHGYGYYKINEQRF